jgi:hypothetical protein
MRSGFESRRADQVGHGIVVGARVDRRIDNALPCPDIRGCPEPQGGVMQQQVRRFTDTHLRGGDRLVRYSAVYGAYAGSIPVRRATSFVPVV